MHRPTDILDDMIDLRDAYATLSGDDRRVAYLYFELEWEQCQIARLMNCSQSTISRAIEKIRVLLNCA